MYEKVTSFKVWQKWNLLYFVSFQLQFRSKMSYIFLNYGLLLNISWSLYTRGSYFCYKIVQMVKQPGLEQFTLGKLSFFAYTESSIIRDWKWRITVSFIKDIYNENRTTFRYNFSQFYLNMYTIAEKIHLKTIYDH
jgi:hypothetical protein